jgi:dolichyl-phosphate-mannose-protein mannosyltransferase
MHERHLLPVFASLAIVAIENPLLIVPYIGFSLTYIANLYFGYVYITDNFRSPYPDLLVKLFEVCNIGFVVMIFSSVVFNLKSEWNKILLKVNQPALLRKALLAGRFSEYKLPKLGLNNKKIKVILGVILTFAFVTRVFNLGSPANEYFDEVYHAFTAKVIMSSEVNKAWEWWNTPPEGFAYEWTHPPLAKLGMVLGMLVFGQNSFGYRIPGALLGVLAVYLIYLIAKKIFDDEGVALLSAAVFSLDGLALVMSRIGMNDSYILFFMLLSLYLFLKNKNFWSALSFGFAIASKWSAIYAVPIFGIIFLSQKKKLKWSYLWFLLLPFTIYLLSYFDMFLTGHTLKTWWEMQQQMWWYHTGLRATHSYSSPWWSWPILMRPIYLYTSDEVMGMVSRIYAFGNPFVFWFGLMSVITSLVVSYVEKNKKLALIVFSYFIFFVPWALSPRIMFLYHYLPSIPFMCIATGYILRRYPKLITYYLLLITFAFIYFYPHWAGLKIPLWLDSSYYWISSWR